MQKKLLCHQSLEKNIHMNQSPCISMLMSQGYFQFFNTLVQNLKKNRSLYTKNKHHLCYGGEEVKLNQI